AGPAPRFHFKSVSVRRTTWSGPWRARISGGLSAGGDVLAGMKSLPRAAVLARAAPHLMLRESGPCGQRRTSEAAQPRASIAIFRASNDTRAMRTAIAALLLAF